MESTGLFAWPPPDLREDRSCASRFASSAGISASFVLLRLGPTFRLGMLIPPLSHLTNVQRVCQQLGQSRVDGAMISMMVAVETDQRAKSFTRTGVELGVVVPSPSSPL